MVRTEDSAGCGREPFQSLGIVRPPKIKQDWRKEEKGIDWVPEARVLMESSDDSEFH